MFPSKTLRNLCHQSLKYKRININFSKCLQHGFVPSSKLHHQQMPLPMVKLKQKEKLEPVNKFTNRTHTCGELTMNNIGESVQLCGWLEFQRIGKFIILRDSYGSTQCIIDEKKPDILQTLQNLQCESVLSVSGRVISRPKGQCNQKMKTGNIEVEVESLEILNHVTQQLPFHIRNYNKAKEFLQMKYRYLAIRFPELQRNLRIRSWVTMKMREFLVNECGFVDVATPTLFRKTPGGAQEFVVPTRFAGKFYSLVQSPQQFKQLLMIGGIDRYFQFAQCYRDEGARNDRQPEFTQLDIEMSFVNREDVMNMTEELIISSWPESLGKLKAPFKRLTYEEAMESYGSDSPDLRIPGTIHNISNIIKHNDDKFDKTFDVYATAFCEKQEFLTKSTVESLKKLSKQLFEDVTLIQLKISNPTLDELSKLLSKSARENIVDNLDLKTGDVLFLTYGSKSNARQLLGRIRVEFANILEQQNVKIRTPGYKFVWIYDFPLFTINKETKVETTHHPFTQPHPEDIQFLLSNPEKVRGLQYDIVLNGSEIGGGSIRIHEKAFQEQIFQMLNIDSSEMYYMLEALSCGAPPHGGIALGLDRYISMICGTSSIREVIAFPKTMEGYDLMSGAPTSISAEEKKLYHLQTLNDPANEDSGKL